MKLIILSGRSGSGKSTALNVLEDIGFICIDNLPASLLPELAATIERNRSKPYAVSIDARNSVSDLKMLPTLIEVPAVSALDAKICFLDADDDCLIQRFSETRRRHPLSDTQTDLRSAIVKEREILDPIVSVANMTIDTTDMGFHEFRDLMKRQIVPEANRQQMSLFFLSFGYKYGVPRNADFVFDARCLPNPHWKQELRALTGKDAAVAEFLSSQDSVNGMFDSIRGFLEAWFPSFEASNRSYLTIAIGCTGGQHRSVYLTQQLSHFFKQHYQDVQSKHRELGIQQ